MYYSTFPFPCGQLSDIDRPSVLHSYPFYILRSLSHELPLPTMYSLTVHDSRSYSAPTRRHCTGSSGALYLPRPSFLQGLVSPSGYPVTYTTLSKQLGASGRGILNDNPKLDYTHHYQDMTLVIVLSVTQRPRGFVSVGCLLSTTTTSTIVP